MVITIECPSCATSFPVDPAKIPEGGVNVRCSACSEVFRVERPEEEVVEAPTPMAGAAVEETEAAPAADTHDEAAAEPAHDDGGFSTMEAPAADDVPSEAAADTGFSTMEAPAAGDASEAADTGFSTMEAPEADSGLVDTPDEWVIETEDATDLPSGDMDFGGGPMTESMDSGDEPFFAETGDTTPAVAEPPTPEAPTGSIGFDAPVADPEPAPAAPEPEPAPAAPEPAPPAPDPAPAAPVQGFTFGKRDPRDKAKRLARVLVSDMIMYNPDRHESALANGTLQEDFADEIEKSWKEYIEQVGPEMAEGEGQEFWRSALNDVLAKGEPLF